MVKTGKIDGYHFGMNMGEPAGQSVMWPHVHFIPRHKGDVEGFPGSVRLAHSRTQRLRVLWISSRT